MSNPEPKEYWTAAVARVLTADTSDLRELALIAGEDPRTLYIGTDLSGCDLRGQDLRGMILDPLDLSRVQHDENTLLDDDVRARASTKAI